MKSATRRHGIGARAPRREDARHLAGRGTFVADLRLAGLREVAFVRSQVPHGRITQIAKPAGTEPGTSIPLDGGWLAG
ncbi:hypothetical protein [Amycolatopsis silviterrae]|uniref:Aldehyde oxidase/xanthine dehydrogenase a/b hammerhead domain-containing protein n=1 Tax=Amycolatopsis silviterrae TaxID=1656914 RepID=A0ABW5HIS4_9PSEU